MSMVTNRLIVALLSRRTERVNKSVFGDMSKVFEIMPHTRGGAISP